MIKVQAIKDPQRDSQPAREDFGLEEKQRGSLIPLAFLTFLTGFAVYLKSFFPRAAEVTGDQPRNPNQNEQQQQTIVENAGEAIDAPSMENSQELEPPDNVVPMQSRGLPQAAVDRFLASDSPPIVFTDAKADRVALGLASNDNKFVLTPLSGGEVNESARKREDREAEARQGEASEGDDGKGGEAEDGEGGEAEGGENEKPPGSPRQPDIGSPRDNREDVARNRLPRTSGPVVLPDLVCCRTYFIPIPALLAGTSDDDGDALKVLALSATSGRLVPLEDGWTFTPDEHALGDVVFSYSITDGTESVQQLALLHIVEALPIMGTDGDDNLIGTACGEVIDGRDGHDNIDARQGDDVIMPGDGDDHISAGDGDDIVHGGAGDDIVFAGAGDDIVYGGSGNDRLFGEAGDDTIFGERGDDFISGGTGDDLLLAGAGADTLDGDAGNDILDGGVGSDTLHGGEGGDRIFGDAGEDRVFGGDGNDVLSDGQGSDSVDGGAGDDHVTAAVDATSDVYKGGAGEDTLDYSSALFSIVIDVGKGTVAGLEVGRDLIAGFERIVGGRGDDHLVAGSMSISMTGGDGDDTFELKKSDDDNHPDLVRKITDFTYGDRILTARYQIIHHEEDGVEPKFNDLFEDIYLSENSDRRPIRFRFEKIDDINLTFIDVSDGPGSEEFYSIELAGHHQLAFTAVVS